MSEGTFSHVVTHIVGVLIHLSVYANSDCWPNHIYEQLVLPVA